MAELVMKNIDRIRIHCYRPDVEFEYVRSRLEVLAQRDAKSHVSIIFSAEEEFQGEII